MQFSLSKLLTLASLVGGALSAPSAVQPGPGEVQVRAPAAEAEAMSPAAPNNNNNNNLEKRASVVVTMWSGDICNGSSDVITVTTGGYRCVPVPSPKRSINAGFVGVGCSVRTWSGTNCAGSSYWAPSGCSGVLYGSVSIQC